VSLDNRYVRGADKLKRRIETIRQNLDIAGLEESIAVLLIDRTRRRFDREVDPSGVPWKDLEPATLKAKDRLNYGKKKKLVRTGRLRDSIKIVRGGIGATYTNTGAGIRIGVEDPDVVEYAKAHQQGLGAMPQRRMFGIGELDVKAVGSLLRRKAKQLESL
jgi:phage gpG-like protein